MANFSSNAQIPECTLKGLIFALLTFCLCFQGSAQSALSSQNKKALKLYEKGQEKARERDFESAIEYFNGALAKDSAFFEAYLRKGSLFNAMGMEDSVYSNFTRYLNIRKSPSPAILHKMAFMAFDRGEYASSKIYLKAYLLQKPDFNEAGEMILLKESIEFAEQEIKKPDTLLITPLPGTINKQRALQYMPSITIDNSMLVFTKRNLLSTSTDFDTYRDEDIMVSFRVGGKWTEARSISQKINSPLNEGASTISSDGRTMIFSSCDRRDSFGSCDLYLTRRVGDNWTKPKSLGKRINTKYWEAQPSLSADGRTLYFSSNRPGGEGSRDLWVAKKKDDGSWSKPLNLGKPLNTKKDETTPFIHPNGQTLYFSSDGHVGLGNYDLYISEKLDSTWQSPRNLGFPINTYNDEAALLIGGDGKTAFYAKEIWKDGEIVESNIATFAMPESTRAKPATYLVGKVSNATTGNPIRTKIEIIDLNGNELLYEFTSDSLTGNYTMVLPSDKELVCYVKKKGYLYFEDNFYTESNSVKAPDTLDIRLRPIAVNESLVLRNIYFDLDSYEINEKSRSEIVNIVQLLRENPSITVEISGHTDNTGSSLYNQTLSEKRAKQVFLEIGIMGIPEQRVSHKGFGANQPLVSNDTEEGRKSNRRIEFRVLRITP